MKDFTGTLQISGGQNRWALGGDVGFNCLVTFYGQVQFHCKLISFLVMIQEKLRVKCERGGEVFTLVSNVVFFFELMSHLLLSPASF